MNLYELTKGIENNVHGNVLIKKQAHIGVRIY